jgi:hypothetical protein
MITGEYDMLCPAAMVYDVAAALGDTPLCTVLYGAAHDMGDPNMTAAVRDAIHEFVSQVSHL